MPNRAKRFCREAGCCNLEVNGTGFCEAHQGVYRDILSARAAKAAECMKKYDGRRGSASARGYDARWAKYARWFLRQPGNAFCALRLDHRCAIVAQCVDHIDPPQGRNDPRFWDTKNHQPACIHCNSVKSNRFMVGTYVYGKELMDNGGKKREADRADRQQKEQKDEG